MEGAIAVQIPLPHTGNYFAGLLKKMLIPAFYSTSIIRNVPINVKEK